MLASWKHSAFARLTTTALLLVLCACGGSLKKAALNTDAGTPGGSNGGTTQQSGINLTPGPIADNFPSFTPTTTASGQSSASGGSLINSNPTGGFGSNGLYSYTGIGNILLSGLYMQPRQAGLVLTQDAGFFSVVGNRLISAPNILSMANFGRSNENIWIGGLVDISAANAIAGFFGRLHDVLGVFHCVTGVQAMNNSGSPILRLVSDNGGTTTNLGQVFLTTTWFNLELILYKDTIAAYVNGRLALSARDPKGTLRQALFGVYGINAAFESMSVANLDTVGENNPISLYAYDFNQPTGSALPFQWQLTSGLAAVVNGKVTPVANTTVIAQMQGQNVGDVDVAFDYELGFGSPRAALIFRNSAAGGYRAEVGFDGARYFLSLFRSNQTAALSGPYTLPPTAAKGRLQVKAHGTDLKAYVDGQIYVKAIDGSFVSGANGFLLQNATLDEFDYKVYR